MTKKNKLKQEMVTNEQRVKGCKRVQKRSASADVCVGGDIDANKKSLY